MSTTSGPVVPLITENFQLLPLASSLRVTVLATVAPFRVIADFLRDPPRPAFIRVYSAKNACKSMSQGRQFGGQLGLQHVPQAPQGFILAQDFHDLKDRR